MKLSIIDLPYPVASCYLKWRDLTGIYDFDIFFNDILLESGMREFKSVITHAFWVDSYYFTIVDTDLKTFNLYKWNNKFIFTLMEEFIEKVNDLYENRNTRGN